ncbi:MAG: pyridoxal 5'-phosphate synthase glutaminase subunit PdxT [Alphaproteobacteria bacterium]|nr:pyridoxal 5'-phosphate synthase glutaminase subunit PdxT [Alphaproteobacteria bacterium]
MTIIIGVLALQGAVSPHKSHIEALGAKYKEVKLDTDCDEVDAYILPGGESSTMLRLVKVFDLEAKLKEEFAKKPVWGICAGSILIASKVTNPSQKCFALMDFTAERNAYGRQVDSHHSLIDGYDVSFIRAPILCDINKKIDVLYEAEDEEGKKEAAWIKQGKYMATTFHPELNLKTPSPMHRTFLNMVKDAVSE